MYLIMICIRPVMKKYFFIIIILLISRGLFAQLSLGLVNGNYSGSYGSIINPSSMANTKLKSDINILALHAFAENNYLYFPSKQSSVIKLFNGAYDYHYIPKPYGTGERNVYAYYYDKSLKNFFIDSRIIGPSVMISVGDNVFGARTSFRMMSSTRRLPYDIANFSFYGMDFKPQHNIIYNNSNYDMASMAWWELKLSYATILSRHRNNHWSAGISLGPAFGYSGAYMVGDETRYIVNNDSILNVENLNAEFGFSMPVDYQNDELDLTHPISRGYGWGMDFGITWQYREKPYQKRGPGYFYKKRFEDYKLKIGVSLIDIGWVNFTKNAEKHVFDNVYNNWIETDKLDYKNVREEMNQISELFYGDPDASLKGNEIKIYMPAMMSVQVDYHFQDSWYVNGTVIIPVKYASPMVERPCVIAVTPRFESRFLEINLPFILYDFSYPHIGLSIRVEGLTIGTDNLGSFTSVKDFTGSDIYISYKINLWNDLQNPYASKGACFNNWRCERKRIHHSDF
jgi:hypothetical protein